jgi:large subunit ribosomal protein L27
MAHKKGASSTKNGRTSISKRLGLKVGHNSFLFSGNIIARQRGYHFKPGKNVGIGHDFSLFALKTGYLKFFDFYNKTKIISII